MPSNDMGRPPHLGVFLRPWDLGLFKSINPGDFFISSLDLPLNVPNETLASFEVCGAHTLS